MVDSRGDALDIRQTQLEAALSLSLEAAKKIQFHGRLSTTCETSNPTHVKLSSLPPMAPNKSFSSMGVLVVQITQRKRDAITIHIDPARDGCAPIGL